MAYFAVALARAGDGWRGNEIDLDEVEDVDGVADLLREMVGEDTTAPAMLFVEEDDEWFGVVRLDQDGDPRVFLSDARATERSDIARRIFEDTAVPADDDEDLGDEDDEEEETVRAAAEPGGDATIMTDLGTPAKRLLELCVEEGQLPGDIISALCEPAGCVEELDRLREG